MLREQNILFRRDNIRASADIHCYAVSCIPLAFGVRHQWTTAASFLISSVKAFKSIISSFNVLYPHYEYRIILSWRKADIFETLNLILHVRKGVIFYLERDIQLFNKISQLVIYWTRQLPYIYTLSRSRDVYRSISRSGCEKHAW